MNNQKCFSYKKDIKGRNSRVENEVKIVNNRGRETWLSYVRFSAVTQRRWLGNILSTTSFAFALLNLHSLKWI